VPTTPRSGTPLAWSLWLLAFGCCAAGLVVTLTVTRPLTATVLAEGAVRALVYPLGYATIGLVLTLRRPANPIGWLFAAAGLAWSLPIPAEPWLDRLVADHRPLPLLAQAAAVYGEFNWAPATVLGVTLPALLVPGARLRSRRWRPVAATTVLYALFVGLSGSLILPLAALVCGTVWARQRQVTGSLVPGMVSHALWSLLMFLWIPGVSS